MGGVSAQLRHVGRRAVRRVAEPLNAISALAFDQLLCAANLSFGHTAISQLGFGTFGFHASGGHDFPNLLDVVPLHCLQMQILHQLMVKAGKGSLPVVMNGKSYAVDTLASSCTASFSALLEECDLDTMVPSLEAQNSQSCPAALSTTLCGQCIALASKTRLPLASGLFRVRILRLLSA